MNAAVETALSTGRRQDFISLPDWECLCAGRHSALLEGPDDSTQALLRLLAPYLRGATWKPWSTPLALPAGECSTLVLQNVTSMDRREQADLLGWLDGQQERTQMVSTTARSLFRLVERGLFDETLYYRLNVMFFCMPCPLPVTTSREAAGRRSAR